MDNITQELNQLQNAVHYEEIREALISALQKIRDNPPFKKKKALFIGDSLTAFTGIIDSQYSAVYPVHGGSVDTVDKMWWKIVVNKLGLKEYHVIATNGLILNNFYNNGHATEQSANGVHWGNDLDLVVLAINIVDTEQEIPLGNYYGGEYPQGGWSTSSFSNLLAQSIIALQKNYPRAKIYVTTPFFVTTANRTISRAVELIHQYCDCIRSTATALGAGTIDWQQCGMNLYNINDWLLDSHDGLHPGAKGQAILGEFTARWIEANTTSTSPIRFPQIGLVRMITYEVDWVHNRLSLVEYNPSVKHPDKFLEFGAPNPTTSDYIPHPDGYNIFIRPKANPTTAPSDELDIFMVTPQEIFVPDGGYDKPQNGMEFIEYSTGAIKRWLNGKFITIGV